MLPQDFERYAAIWACPETVAYIGGRPWDRARAWASFLRNAGHWAVVGFGQWAIQPHGETQMMGQVGFFTAKAGLGEDFDAFPEAGWMLHPDAQGAGFGPEAAEAAHEWFDRVVTGPLVCKIAVTHTRSLELADQLGYRALRDIEVEGDDVRLMIRKAPPGGRDGLLEAAAGDRA